MTKKEEQALLIFERKIFRRIYCPKHENGEWKSRTNQELEEMSKGENVVKWIMGQRIGWLGHLERTEEERMPKKIFTQELEGMKRRGRTRRGCRVIYLKMFTVMYPFFGRSELRCCFIYSSVLARYFAKCYTLLVCKMMGFFND